MKLTRLSLTNFRNLGRLAVDFTASVTALVGANGQGKTNFLEAIRFLALGRCPRTPDSTHLLTHGADFLRVSGEVVANSQKVTLEIALTRAGEKILRVDGRPTSAAKFVGRLPVVSFFPDDLNALTLEPVRRRRLLDTLLAQLSREYAAALVEYTRIVKQRNALLDRLAQNQAEPTELDFWNGQTARWGSAILAARAKLLVQIAPLAAAHFARLTDSTKTLTLALSTESGVTSESFLAELHATQREDLRRGITHFGPHRQDLLVSLNSAPAGSEASRGELREIILAWKLAELELLTRVHGSRPVLLLDDVFSELDEKRRALLRGEIERGQTLLTTTDRAHVADFPAAVWEMRNSMVQSGNDVDSINVSF